MLRAFPALFRLPIPSFPISNKTTSAFSRMSSTPSPKCPKFIPVEESKICSISKADGIRFSLVSYNILAQVYVKSSLFPHSPSSCLRADLVLEEKIEYNDLVNSIKDGNIPGDDKPNDKEATGNEDARSKNGSTVETTQDRGDPNDPRVRLKRDCVGIMAAFKLKHPCNHFVIVANTHLYWDPSWADVKLAQAKYLVSRLAQFKTLVSDRFECTPSLIVAGDFNSVPGDKVYQYLISGNTSSAPTMDILEDLPIPLCSTYAYTRGEPQFTNCTPGFTGTLDYIFFSPSDHIKPVSFLELPGPDSSDVDGGLPNLFHPSDHLPIGVEFEISRE
ncbi:carbon catabolite repressor protein 4 homolog 4 isoform X5 [Malus sylvestris]|uniref:carbon catabolite repressor protein 4 homolog 4 isoform X5 n=1 Tax=Malus sylvestris TaxID=3752 RepID=UPI0021ACB3CA|nr:carbon catabolite repressor protein 4 homolog 4 isoform X5 [Malus sylvestris]